MASLLHKEMNKVAKSVYSDDTIHCVCGQSFRAGLEARLSDELWEDGGFDNEIGEEEKYNCPRCGTQFVLEIRVEKTVTTTYQHLEVLGRFITNDYGSELNIMNLQSIWSGEVASIDGEEREEFIFPDGIYLTGGKEIHVEDGTISNYWGVFDSNQISLFEETIQ